MFDAKYSCNFFVSNLELFTGSRNIRKECFYKENWRSQKQNHKGKVWSQSPGKIISKYRKDRFSFPSSQVGLPALQSEEKFPSNGSLLAQNGNNILRGGEMLRKIKCKIKGIKYCSEPELKGGDCAHAHAPDRCGSRACSEGPECAGYVNIEARGGQTACCPPSSLMLFWELGFFFLVDMNVHEHFLFNSKLLTRTFLAWRHLFCSSC